MNDETMDELNADTAEVTSLRAWAGERNAERAAEKGLAGLFEWMMTGRVL
jgi:hypothetical protein